MFENKNEKNRKEWLERTLASIPDGSKLLDAGAGELANRKFCEHLTYVSQDFSQYDGSGDGSGLQKSTWDTSKIDIVSDIAGIPEPNESYDAILCSEVLEHVPNPVSVLQEFSRLLKPQGEVILTAPFASLVHFAPYHYCTGFSRYWYEHHLPALGFEITEITANGDWFELCEQELGRLRSSARRYGSAIWPLALVPQVVGWIFFRLMNVNRSSDLACFGWHVRARKVEVDQ